MADDVDAFQLKADESLASAESDFADGRFNSYANRSYYACYQAAVAALHRAGIAPRGARWRHPDVQARFVEQLINRRKAYPAGLQDALARTADLRQQADYETRPVSRTEAARTLRRAREFVAATRVRR